MTDIVASLPEDLRSELKEPLGPIFTESEPLLTDVDGPLVAVGDVVTYHLISAGYTPAVALVDERTEREAVDDEVAETIATFDGFDRIRQVDNPAATLTEDLLVALREGIQSGETTLLEVDGEEDLAALPAVVLLPDGGTIVYGQPGEGMVRATVDADLRAEMWDLFARMDGEESRLREILEE